AHHLAVGDDAGVAGLDVIGGQPGLDAVRIDAVHVGGPGHHHVVAHHVFGHLAGVLQVDGEVGAAFGYVDVGDVVAHGVVALHVHRAGVGGMGGAGGAKGEGGGDHQFAEHGKTPVATGLPCERAADNAATGIAGRQ